MRKALLLATSIFLCIPAFGANPDAGLLTRLVCYETTENGNASTRDTSFTVIVQQTEVDRYDASYFSPGNDNFSAISTLNENFEVYVFHNADTVSTNQNIREYADELMASEPTYPPAAARGIRVMQSITVSWENSLNEVFWDRNHQSASTYVNNSDTDDNVRSIFCEDPYGVATVTPPAPQPERDVQGQSAELGVTQGSVNSEI